MFGNAYFGGRYFGHAYFGGAVVEGGKSHAGLAKAQRAANAGVKEWLEDYYLKQNKKRDDAKKVVEEKPKSEFRFRPIEKFVPEHAPRLEPEIAIRPVVQETPSMSELIAPVLARTYSAPRPDLDLHADDEEVMAVLLLTI